MRKTDADGSIELDLNDPTFQDNLLNLPKEDRHAALETLKKIRRLSWNQLYRDNGLKWERINRVEPPAGVAGVYSLRITRSRRATAYRDGAVMRLLSIAPDHDAAYGKK